jgi:hypothetical protein
MIKQPRNSSLCGQCCLGTILNVSLGQSIKLVGHKHGTRLKDLSAHFKASSTRLIRGFPKNYSLCKVHYKNFNGTHWVLYRNFKIYDPNIGEWTPFEVWQECFSHVIPRITSYVEIEENAQNA